MGYLLGAVFAVIGLANLAIVFGWLVLRRNGTLIPLLGGLAGACACLALPVPALHQWWFMPLILDPGSAPLLILAFDCYFFPPGAAGRASSGFKPLT